MNQPHTLHRAAQAVLGAAGREFTPGSSVLVAGAPSLARDLIAVGESLVV
ncbi:hypothetical protein ACF08M_37245 [Streptomyces sp. NPDC015032]